MGSCQVAAEEGEESDEAKGRKEEGKDEGRKGKVKDDGGETLNTNETTRFEVFA